MVCLDNAPIRQVQPLDTPVADNAVHRRAGDEVDAFGTMQVAEPAAQTRTEYAFQGKGGRLDHGHLRT